VVVVAARCALAEHCVGGILRQVAEGDRQYEDDAAQQLALFQRQIVARTGLVPLLELLVGVEMVR
jgi:hypothetical protein